MPGERSRGIDMTFEFHLSFSYHRNRLFKRRSPQSRRKRRRGGGVGGLGRLCRRRRGWGRGRAGRGEEGGGGDGRGGARLREKEQERVREEMTEREENSEYDKFSFRPSIPARKDAALTQTRFWLMLQMWRDGFTCEFGIKDREWEKKSFQFFKGKTSGLNSSFSSYRTHEIHAVLNQIIIESMNFIASEIKSNFDFLFLFSQ